MKEEKSTKISRRAFIKGASVGFLALSMSTLKINEVSALQEGSDGGYFYRDWEDLFRQKWGWDKVVRGSHTYINCVSTCAWDIYVKDGIIWREEQTATYPPINSELPDFNPRGCQKGASYSTVTYSPGRIKYPMKRVGQRGEGKWQKISWEEAMDEIATKLVEVIQTHGSECIMNDMATNLAVCIGPHSAARWRFFDLLGGIFNDSWGEINDLTMGACQTFGQSHIEGTADDWFNSNYIMLWNFNPAYTRIPEAHFLMEARYNGAKIVSVAPDLNASSIHADQWVNLKIGTDVALCLGMAKVIIDEKLYALDHIREQTDLPFLVRQDTKTFLREKDLEEGGKEEVFYFWDLKTNLLQKVPGSMGSKERSLRLNGVEPAIEGTYEVKTAQGQTLTVRPVFESLKELVASYPLEEASKITGVNPQVISQLAREFAQAKAGMIITGMGANKFYHGDLMTRARILLCALCGHTGKPGGGFRVYTWHVMEGFDLFAFPYVAKAIMDKGVTIDQIDEKVDELGIANMTPSTLFWYIHGGIREVAGKKEFGDTSIEGNFDDYVMESIEKGWMPLFPKLGKDVKVLFLSGGNPLRRTRSYPFLLKNFWPKLDLVVSVNFRMDNSSLYADIILPAAGYYEKMGIKYPAVYLPFLNLGDKAIDPLYESKNEWEIFSLIAKRVQEKAQEKGLGPYIDGVIGLQRDLSTFYDAYSMQGKFGPKDEEAILEHIMQNSQITKGVTLQELRETGYVKIKNTGPHYRPYGQTSPYQGDKALAPCQFYTLDKKPWPTLTGRQQFYIDHPWYLKFKEELPVYKPSPKAGGNYPLKMTGGHTRWSIHSIWRDNTYMLRLQRGVPVMYMNAQDAQERGIKDHDYVKVYNDVGTFQIHVKVGSSVQRGQVIVYHAWEPFQFSNQSNQQVLIPTPMKPLQMAGGQGHIRYNYGHCAPGQSDRDTQVEVVKA